MKSLKCDYNLIFLHIKYHKWIYVLLIVCLYFLILPYSLYIVNQNTEIKDIVFYECLQKYILIICLFFLIPFIKNYIEEDIKEILLTYDQKYKIRFVLEIYFLFIFILLPIFVLGIFFFFDILSYIIWFVFQIFIIYIFFYLFTLRFHSTLISFIIIFSYHGYMNFFVQNPTIFNLYRSFGFYDTPMSYFIFWIFISIILVYICIKLEKHQFLL